MSTAIFNVPSLEGEACVRVISSALRSAPGIVGVQVDVENKHVAVDFDSAVINEVQVMQLVRDTGYEVE
jgi:copper chaperone CopZ